MPAPALCQLAMAPALIAKAIPSWQSSHRPRRPLARRILGERATRCGRNLVRRRASIAAGRFPPQMAATLSRARRFPASIWGGGGGSRAGMRPGKVRHRLRARTALGAWRTQGGAGAWLLIMTTHVRDTPGKGQRKLCVG